jgi:AcrR family transcriptional regulator
MAEGSEVEGKVDRRRQAGARTRQRLIEVTRDLLAERGPDSVRLRDVTDAAGANVAAVHYHFGSLKALRRAAIIETFNAAVAEQNEEIAGLPEDATLEDVVRVWVRRRAAGLLDSAGGSPLIGLYSRLLYDTPPDLREWVVEATKQAAVELIARLQLFLPGLDDDELAFRVACVAGTVHHLRTPRMQQLVSGQSVDEVVERMTSVAVGLLRSGVRGGGRSKTGRR